MCKHFARLKMAGRYAHFKCIDAQALQDVLARQDNSYQRFFAWRKGVGPKVGLPGFKKVKKYTSFTLKQCSWKLLGGNRIRLRGRNYKFAKHREINGEIKTVTVKRDRLTNLYLCFSVMRDIEPIGVSTGQIGGFDFGLTQSRTHWVVKTFLTDDRGNEYSMPEHFKSALDEVARLNRSLSRKRKGSRNWRKAKRRLAATHERVANRRRDFHFKLALHLVREFDVICIEDLNIDGMKRLWGRKVSDLGFMQFVAILEHVTARRLSGSTGASRARRPAACAGTGRSCRCANGNSTAAFVVSRLAGITMPHAISKGSGHRPSG